MKNLLFAIALLLASPHLARASFLNDVKGQEIQCTGRQVTVTIKVDRKTFSIEDAMNQGHPELYDVTKRNSDDESFVEYQASEAWVRFSDAGDTLEYRPSGPSVRLKCRFPR